MQLISPRIRTPDTRRASTTLPSACGRNALLALSLALASPLSAQESSPAACIPPLSYLPLDVAKVGADANGTAALGTYERISPDGRFILRSYSGAMLGKVSLMELPASGSGSVRVYRTPFSNEAFPVQGTWRYLVDVTGEHFRFADVLHLQTQARALFKAGMTGFYAAASELTSAEAATGSTPPGRIFIRSLSWPQNADSDSQGVGSLQITTVEIQDDGKTAKVVGSTGMQFICQNRQATDGGVFALPMISVDGHEFSAIPQAPASGQPSMRVYGLSASATGSAHPCDLRADLGFSPGKAVFGFPQVQGGPAWLTYSDLGHVYAHDRATGQSFRLDHQRYRVAASAFPGLTRDGRVIYGATWRDCSDMARCPEKTGYVVADPYQSQAYQSHWKGRGQTPPKACITQHEVSDQRIRFARMHKLAVGESTP